MDSDSALELQELLKQAKRGDTEAFTTVYQTYFLPVYRYLYRRLKNKQDAEDLCQSVFLKVYNSSATFENQNKNPLAYFFTVARNSLTDHWRKHRMSFPLDEAGQETSPTNITEQLDQKQTITTALSYLEQDQRTVLTMKFIEGYSNEDIGRTLNKSQEAIRQIQCRALKKLREIMNK